MTIRFFEEYFVHSLTQLFDCGCKGVMRSWLHKHTRAGLTQLSIGPQDIGHVLGAELAHTVLAGLGHSVYEGTRVIPQVGIRPHLHTQPRLAVTAGRGVAGPSLHKAIWLQVARL